jgi:hypothetical protein
MVYFENNIRFSRRDDLKSANVESMWFELFTKQSYVLVNITYKSTRLCDPNFLTLFHDMLKAAIDEPQKNIVTPGSCFHSAQNSIRRIFLMKTDILFS